MASQPGKQTIAIQLQYGVVDFNYILPQEVHQIVNKVFNVNLSL